MNMICFGLFVMVCQPMAQPASQHASFCQVYQPIYWSAKDTRKTKEQVDKLNAKWSRLCKRS